MYYQPSTQKEFTTHSEVRAAFPQISMPTILTDEILLTFEVYPLIKSPPPFDPITHYAREIDPKLINGHYEQDYEVLALDAATVVANVMTKKAALKEQATNKRIQVEEGGTTLAGVPVKTDAGSQAKLTGALNFVGRNPNRTIKWKTAAGTFAPLNKAAIEAISDGVGEFVALCFDAEAAHYAAIDVLTTHAQVAAYDVNTGWPA